MKKLSKLTLMVILIVFTINCEKDENLPPTCSIISPQNGAIIDFGNKITISVSASDIDGQIKEVTCYIGQKLIGSKQNHPYNFEVPEGSLPGVYSIKAIAIDSDGLSAETKSHSITISAINPVVVTLETISVGSNKIEIKGRVDDDGGASISSRGFCWNTSGNPSINNNKIDIGSGLGEFEGIIENLDPGKKYYISAFATNIKGTTYGNVKEVVTNTIIPSVNTIEVSNVEARSAIGKGEVINNGGSEVLDRGICFSLNSNPTIENDKISGGIGVGVFECTLIELTPNSKYYMKAYAENSKGVSYGDELEFTTLVGSPMVSIINISNITAYSVNAYGEIISNGGDTIVRNGFCYNKIGSPTINDTVVDSDLGGNSFNFGINNLDPGTTYFISSFAENSIGIAYSDVLEFNTNAIIPEVVTKEALSISYYSAETEGEISYDGGDEVIKKGICWNTTGNPSINDNKTDEGSGDNIFTSTFTNLLPNTKYYFRVYAQNSVGVGYGQVKSFNTLELPAPMWLRDDTGDFSGTIGLVSGSTPTVFYVRFEKPLNWEACKITSVNLGLLNTVGWAFEIVAFDNTQYSGGKPFPKGPVNVLKQVEYIYTSSSGNWQVFNVSKTINTQYFYIGMKTNSVLGPKMAFNLFTPASDNNTSGIYQGDDAIAIINDANFFVRVFIEYTQGSSSKSSWIDADIEFNRKSIFTPIDELFNE